MNSGTIRYTATKDKGYFFIHVDGQQDVFCHLKNVSLADEQITKGTRVKFDLRPARDGRIQAFDVVLDDTATTPKTVDAQSFITGKIDDGAQGNGGAE